MALGGGRWCLAFLGDGVGGWMGEMGSYLEFWDGVVRLMGGWTLVCMELSCLVNRIFPPLRFLVVFYR